MFTIAANDIITRNVNFVVAHRIIKPRLINRSKSKTLSSSMCFGKLAIFKEANLKPRIEGKKAEDSRDRFEFSSTTDISSVLEDT